MGKHKKKKNLKPTIPDLDKYLETIMFLAQCKVQDLEPVLVVNTRINTHIPKMFDGLKIIEDGAAPVGQIFLLAMEKSQ